MANRLASEPSPYLLQHKDNPVDWFPWGDEAFARARAEQKPIFLSVGYSTCHWCHVMAHESFENAEVAAVLNRDFVAIKVDREERPDVDRVYMAFVQATTGSGGWPMSVWLTPALQPFYGGTYFPPTTRWGRPGFVDILQEIARSWQDDRDRVLESGATILERLRGLRASSGPSGVPGTGVLDRVAGEFAASFDRQRGGFGDAPKFPRPSELLFLLREHARTGAAEPRDMVLATLQAMALGGMRDHIGGGFHRYSVDGNWRVPHFEKMLYDQAQLVLAYLEGAQVSGQPYYAEVAADTLEYVRRDLTDAAGGFYSAEDADSLPPESAGDPSAHKMEGAFYVWRDEEIGEALGADADLFRARYGFRPDGNAPSDPQGEFIGKNLLYTARSLEEVGAPAGLSAMEAHQRLRHARQLLQVRRATRPRPHLDDKVLTAWNGLMIAAFARASRVLGDAGCADTARRAASFIHEQMWNASTGSLVRRYRQRHASVDAYAEDYAYLTFGLLELFQADGDPRWLEWARTLQQRLDDVFWDPVDGGWFSTTGQDASVLLRLKEDYDGAEPAASSIAVMNLLMLSHLAAETADDDRIERTLGLFASRAAQVGRAVPMMLAALSTYHAGVPQIVIAGDPDRQDTAALMDVVRRTYLPGALVIPIVPRHRAAMTRALPWTEAMDLKEGRATAYVCRNFTCHAPTIDAVELSAHLEASRAHE